MLERWRRLHPPLLHALLDAFDHRLDHLHSRVALRVTLDQAPRSVRLVGTGEHVLDRILVFAPLLAVAPVVVGQLPRLQRIALSSLEALQLLRFGDVEPELDQDHALVGQHPLEAVDLVVGAKPLLAGGEALDALDQHPPVTRAVEDRHAAPTWQHPEEPPEEMVALLVGRWRGELDDTYVAGIGAGHKPLDRPALAGRVPTLEHDACGRSELSFADLTAEGQAKLRESLPCPVERAGFLLARERRRQVEFVEAAQGRDP